MAKNDILMYKGRPLVRDGDILYYGFMDEPYVVIMRVISKRELKGVEVADKVLVQLVSTNTDASPKERISKKVERKGLYNAIDIGSIWLERELKKSS